MNKLIANLSDVHLKENYDLIVKVFTSVFTTWYFVKRQPGVKSWGSGQELLTYCTFPFFSYFIFRPVRAMFILRAIREEYSIRVQRKALEAIDERLIAMDLVIDHGNSITEYRNSDRNSEGFIFTKKYCYEVPETVEHSSR
jgi:hypothetical protein